MRRGSARAVAGDALHPLLVRASVHRIDALHLFLPPALASALTRTSIIRMSGPAQAKSNTSGKARTTVQAQTAYTTR